MAGACGWMSSTPTGSTPGAPRPDTEYLVGIAVRAHGLRGELVVDVHTDSPDERFAAGASLIAQRPGAPSGTLTVESARPHSGRLLVRFVEVPDRDAAEALRGTRLLVAADAITPPADDEEFHVHQLEGLRAELVDGTVAGTVREVVHGPGGELLVLARPGGGPDILVPFVQAIVPTVDLAGGRLVLTPPEGLLDPA
ncbi:16S rRNA processing protein RimM [Pseudonocardia kunmingensis]|uniref:Ribosome maturation factor RimM n=2 Tax=Pseudonocardia kunmingensis TaxID=630975 RepID=A0A543DZ43_9PSEU|nr:16S rRNA processing protein RimM [Pseudonocardia kunmingensis]